MPLENALVMVGREYQRFFTKREQGEHAGITLRAGDLVDDFLARECLASYTVPLSIRHLLFLLTEGKHLYWNELDLLIGYLKNRKGQLEGTCLCSFSDHPFPQTLQRMKTGNFSLNCQHIPLVI